MALGAKSYSRKDYTQVDNLEIEELQLRNRQLQLELQNSTNVNNSLYPSRFCVVIIKQVQRKMMKESEFEIKKLKKDKIELENEIDNQRRVYRKQIIGTQDRTEENLATIKKLQKKIETEAPLIREKVENLKEELKDMLISENQYLELRLIPEEQRDLKQYVLIF